MGEYDNTVAGRIGLGLFSESLGDGGNILGVREPVRASPSLGFCFVTDEIVDVWKNLLELSTEKLSDEGSREVENEDLG